MTTLLLELQAPCRSLYMARQTMVLTGFSSNFSYRKHFPGMVNALA